MGKSPMVDDVAALERGIDGAIIAPVGHLPNAPDAVRKAVEYLLRTRHYPPISIDFAGAVEIAGTLIVTAGDDQWTLETPIALPNGKTVNAASAWNQMHMDNLDWEEALDPTPNIERIILR